MSLENSKGYKQIAEDILQQIKDGTSPLLKQWEVAPSAPHNPISGTSYRGINNLTLQHQGRTDPRWMTYKQAKSKEYQVRKGETGSPIVFWQFNKEVTKKDSSGKPVKNNSGKTVKENIKLARPRLFSATVFNAEQMDGVPAMEQPPRIDNFQKHDRAEGILKESGANISYGGDRAFYSPSQDRIQLPERESFKSEAAMYAIALHELGHWTAHEDRLDRDLGGKYGTPKYAKEELRAEIFSFMASSELQLPFDPSQHVAYVENWAQILEDKPTEIYAASRDAEQIKDYVLKFDRTLDQEQTQEQTKTVTAERVPEFTTNPASSTNEDNGLDKKSTGEVSRVDPDKVIEWKVEDTQYEGIVSVTRTNHSNGEVGQMDIRGDKDDLQAHFNTDPSYRFDVEEAYPGLSDDEHSFLKTGNTPEMWSEKERMRDAEKEQNHLKQSNVAEDKEPPVVRNVDIKQDLKKACESLGLVMNSEPVFDGKFHRVPVDRGDDKANKDGSYKAFSDGVPAAVIVNHYTGQQRNWKANSVAKALSPEERKAISERSKENTIKTAAATTKTHEHKARRVEQLVSVLPKATDDNKYLQNKGIKASANVFEDKRGRLVVPVTDAKGNMQSMVRINSTGSFKQNLPGGKMAGGMHMIGKPKAGENVIVTEGYSTAKTINEATGIPTAAAFSANNLANVAHAVQQAYTSATVFVAGDNDVANDRNVGRIKATEAAQSVGSRAIFPKIPAGKKGSDFNDLGKLSGSAEVRSQIESGIKRGRAAEPHQQREIKKENEQVKVQKRSRSVARTR